MAGHSWLAAMMMLAGCEKLLSFETVRTAGHGPWTTVAVGGQHACALETDGTLWCWGDNSSSQLGIAASPEVDVPTQVGTARWRALSAGGAFTCGIRTDDSLWCWGETEFGQTGTGQRGVYTQNDRLGSTTYVTPTPTQVEGTWKTVTTGASFACGLQRDDTLWCWGKNDEGQLANDDTTLLRTSPIPAGTGTWASVSAGSYHACGIQTDGTLWCWGAGNNGQLGTGTSPSSTPVVTQVGLDIGVTAWRAVDAGGDGTCAIADSDDAPLYCWGMPTQAHSPVLVTVSKAPFNFVDDVVVGGSAEVTSICALRNDRSLACWGDDSRGQVGPLAGNNPIVPEPVPFAGGAAPWASVDVGDQTTCAIGADASLWCAGAGNRGQLANGIGSHRVPMQVPGTWTRVRAGTNATCAIDPSGQASCTGSNLYGGIGDGTYLDRATFVPIGTTSTMSDLAVGAQSACGIATDGSTWCWGDNSYCHLGDACTSGKLAMPTKMAVGFEPIAMAMYDHTCAIDANHGMWCYGNDSDGQTGTGASVPTQVMGAQAWQQVSVGPYHTCATTSDVTFCWGVTKYGELGGGSPTSVDQLAPAQVGGTATFLSVAAGDHHTCGIARDHSAYCWGEGDAGQLGVNGLGTEFYPTRVGGQWTQLASGAYHTCGIGLDGTLSCWGENAYGQLGDGTFESRDVPTPAGDPDAHWVDLAAGGAHTCALRDDGTLWCWGLDDSGQLGDGTGWSDQLLRVP